MRLPHHRDSTLVSPRVWLPADCRRWAGFAFVARTALAINASTAPHRSSSSPSSSPCGDAASPDRPACGLAPQTTPDPTARTRRPNLRCRARAVPSPKIAGIEPRHQPATAAHDTFRPRKRLVTGVSIRKIDTPKTPVDAPKRAVEPRKHPIETAQSQLNRACFLARTIRNGRSRSQKSACQIGSVWQNGGLGMTASTAVLPVRCPARRRLKTSSLTNRPQRRFRILWAADTRTQYSLRYPT